MTIIPGCWNSEINPIFSYDFVKYVLFVAHIPVVCLSAWWTIRTLLTSVIDMRGYYDLTAGINQSTPDQVQV